MFDPIAMGLSRSTSGGPPKALMTASPVQVLARVTQRVVPVRVLGALETTRQYAESVASTPLVRVSEHCDDGSLCTIDVFNGATGRCMHPPFCPPGGPGCLIGTAFPTLSVTTQRPECRVPESTEAQHGSGESRTNVPAAGRPLVGGGS